MNFKQAMCQAVVDGWHGDWKMSRVVGYSWALAEIEPDNEQEKYQVFADAAKVRWIHASDRAQVWIAKEMPRLNESLWAGRPRQTCVDVAARIFGVRRDGANLQISVRARDDRTDWKTVK